MTNREKIAKDYNLFCDKITKECWESEKKYKIDSYMICVDSANKSRDLADQNDTSFYTEFFKILRENLEQASFCKEIKIVDDAKYLAEVAYRNFIKE